MIPLYFEKISRYDRNEEPCTVAVPFAQGKLKALSRISVLDNGKPVPTQVKTTATWPDNSIKWVHVNFLANLPGNQSKSFDLRTDARPVMPANPVTTTFDTDIPEINTGTLKILLNKPGKFGLFNKIISDTMVISSDNIAGPAITDKADNRWILKVGKSGWKVIEDGPVRAVVQTTGKHCSDKGDFIDYVVRIYAYAGKPWFRLDYQIIHCEEEKEIVLKRIDLRFSPVAKTPNRVRTSAGLSNLQSYRTTIDSNENGESITQVINQDKIINVYIEHAPETYIGTHWADWNDPQTGGLCMSHFQAHQNFPKGFISDAQGITAQYLPDDIVNFNLDQGMAKTHSLLVYFHGPDETLEDINCRTLQFQMPDQAILAPEIYREADVLENVWVKNPIQETERFFAETIDMRTRAYGILHWGDCPAPNYTNQGRGAGSLVWANNEYDFPHASMLHFIRTGERRFMDNVLTAAAHWIDVDICHYSKDSLRKDGQIIHSVRHVEGKVEPSHQWVEGLLDYYHLTGEQQALDSAWGIGENLLRHMEMREELQTPGAASARDTGWALRSFVALYRETHDEKWLKISETIVDQFKKWYEKYGAFLAPYTDHTLVRIPFMISIAASSLMRFYRITHDETVAELIVATVKDMIDNCLMPDGLFIYKELPSLKRRMNVPSIVEACAAAYEITGNKIFLESALPLFNSRTKHDFNRVADWGPKKSIDDTIIHPGGFSPIGFAISYYPFMLFYRHAIEAGIL